jgi:hypothetical protein
VPSESPRSGDLANAENPAPGSDDIPQQCAETEIAQAIERNDVWFSHLVRAQYAHVWAPKDVEPCWRQLAPKARSSFAETHGGIGETLFLPGVPGGVMMTGDGSLFAEVWLNRLSYDITEARAFLFDLEVLRERVDLYLPVDAGSHRRKHRVAATEDPEPSNAHSGNAERDVCMRKLLLLYRGLLGTLDTEVKRTQADRGLSESYRREMAELRRELAGAEETFISFVRPRAEHRYMMGTLLGALGAAVLVGALAVALELADAGGLWVAAAAAGAGGAVMSVWTRMQSKQLQVDIDAGPLDLLVSGALRPVVGALSALGIYVFVEAGIVPLDVPEEPTERSFFVAGIAFLAGFSERLAGDAFGRGAASFSTVSRAGS